jgi:ADP-ribose pyrophosphatase YjhB (NUDIX family)
MKTLLGKLWRWLPPRVRNFGVRFVMARFTATVACVIEDDAGRILLLKHRFRTGSGWGIPGGFINAGEQPEEALRREVCEEVGLDLRALHFVFVRTRKRPNNIEFIYRGASGATKPVTPRSIEIISLAWFALDALPHNLAQDQHRLIRRALAARESANLFSP